MTPPKLESGCSTPIGTRTQGVRVRNVSERLEARQTRYTLTARRVECNTSASSLSLALSIQTTVACGGAASSLRIMHDTAGGILRTNSICAENDTYWPFVSQNIETLLGICSVGTYLDKLVRS